ncbi:Pycsar system effector family protein [Sphingomonas sp. ABOLE]|uniref:Pycsar system effector family protein n=1 Tax=Sphingomonas sp. ABOLE TaxID=1985878 RepID=UPI000F7F8185|nr:Pycsar system effector family protein [Sphingomonas sp. ABOLE]
MTNQNQSASAEHTPRLIVEKVQSAPSLAVPETGHGEIVPSPAPTLEEHHKNFAEFHESYVRNYISLADTKAAWAFAIVSGALVYLIGTDKTKTALLAPALSLSYASLIAAALLLVVSAFFSFRVVAPRLTSKSGDGIVFFGSVAAKNNAASYVSEVAAHDFAEITEARLKHCFDVSKVCAEKYASLKKAIWFGLLALAVTLAAVLLNN